MSNLVLPKGAAQALHELTGEPRPEAALLLALRDAYAYRMEQIQAGLQKFEAKYGMSFAEYQSLWEQEEREEDYTWERENDYLEWEALVTRKQRLDRQFEMLT